MGRRFGLRERQDLSAALPLLDAAEPARGELSISHGSFLFFDHTKALLLELQVQIQTAAEHVGHA